MGGAFDPVHFGHLRSAVELQERLQLGELRFVPSANPQHRPPHVASAELRMRMLQAAVVDMAGCTIDDRELNRQGPSWSVVTLEELRAEIGSRSLCMILGMDAFRGLPDWHRWERPVWACAYCRGEPAGFGAAGKGRSGRIAGGSRNP